MNFNLTVNSCNPPIDSLIIAEIINIRHKDIINVTWCNDWKYEGNVRLYCKDILLLEDKNNTIGRYFARTMDPDLYGSDNPNDRTETDHWLSFMIDPLRSSILKENIMSYLDRTLMTRTWLVTKKLTIADISVFSVLIEEQSFVKYEKKYPNVFRWYKEMLSLPAVVTVLAAIEKNKISAKDMKDHGTQKSFNTKAQQGNCKQEGKFINLPGAKMGEVVVRFPPEPSGYLHIGHAKAVLLNQYYADTFRGKLIIRFDDTNPAKENVTFMQAILEDLDLLQIKSHKITHTSDYFDVILDYCTKLIEEGKAYVDDTPAEIMKEQRDRKEPSVNRENSVKKNLLLWEEMQQGTNEGQKCCVRAKIDYKSTNGCLRDPTIYRCKPEPHPRTGRKYAVYPTYDFACPIVDVIENVTHTLRTTEYHDRDDQFYWVIDALGLCRPYIWEYSRLNMTNTVLSKRKLTWFVTEGLVDGWDDPRLPTVRGILRRGMTVDGLKQFIVAQGSSRSVVFMEWDKIWALNKKIIDPIAHRYTALDRADMVPVHVIDAKDEWLTVQNHPKDPSKGTKIVHVSSNIFIERNDADTLVEGQDTTFINWGNLLIQKIERRNSAVTKIQAKLNLDNKNYKNTLKITWLSASSGNKEDRLVPCYAVYFDHIINQPVLGKEEDFKHFITKDSRREVHMLGEAELKRVKKGEIIELQRKGFFRCDVQYDLSSFSSRERPVILFHIPDGRSGTFGTNRLTDAVGKKTVKTNSGELTDNAGERADDKRGEATVAVRLETSSHLKSASETDKSATNLKFTAVSSLATNANCRKLANQLTERCEKVKQLEDLLKQEKMHVQSLKMEYKSSTGMEWELKQPCTIVTSDCANNKDNAELRVEDLSEVSREIEKQGNKIRELKNAGTAKDIVDKEVRLLLSLKNDYKALTGGKDWMPSKADNIRSADKSSDEQKETLCANEMSEEIGKQADKVRQLKSLKAEKTVIDREVKTLLRLKSDYTSATGMVWQQTKETLRKNKRSESNPPMKNVHSKNITAKELDTNKTGTRLGLEAKKKENFFDWYSQVITKSGMIEYYDVSGCYILRPWSYAIWKIIKEYIDNEITDLGVQECYFPIFVTRTVLEKEKTHIADFAPEVAWVTKCGNSDLIEPIAIRPTSETVMYPAYAKWLRSDTELPLRLNQWNNVVRWEFKDPKPFLRTREFLWQEGHTAFATKAEADAEVLIILDMYSRVYEQLLAVPVIKGRKTEKEKFAGGEYTTTVEAFISTSGRAVQGATSHHLGQNFSKMFNIQVEGMAAATEGDGKTFVYQNSWGLTTRTIGVMIMVHGDDKGLVLPPNVSSVQAVLVPCGITANTTTEERDLLQAECVKLVNELMKDKDLRLKADYRSNRTPGWKFNHWELKGVPVRIELGPKDVKRDQVTFVRRDTSEKIIVNRSAVRESLRQLLQDIQNSMLMRARKDLNEHIKQTENWNTFGIELNKKNLLLSPFCGEPSCEERIKMDSAREDTGEELGALFMGAKSLCIPFQQPQSCIPIEDLHCIHPDCQNKSKFYALFGRSY